MIAKLPDVNAVQVARRISEVTLTDEQFLPILENPAYALKRFGNGIRCFWCIPFPPACG
jgi:hypothetical protein